MHCALGTSEKQSETTCLYWAGRTSRTQGKHICKFF